MSGVLLLVAVFVAGVAAGFGLERVTEPRMLQTRLITQMPQVFRRLGLTPEQQRTVDSLLEQSQPRAAAAMRETVPRLRAIADSLDAELRQILTPAQRARLDSLGGFRLLLKRKSIDGQKVDTL
ncbi:MAG TPA: hypothetical protein VGQ69_00420 [Gemmatimonadales bacterium]|nr:hypothetical protein [Gemmatimonadales bacterium]